jgi:nicotinate-nucleotide adenylyltransferase
VTTGLYGGVFDPPHNGHVALAEAALEHFAPEPLLVLVAVDPGHKPADLDFETRFELARLAFGGLPRAQVVPDEHPRTIDMLRAESFDDPIFLVGADQFTDFLSWKEPNAVLELARLGVATRPGFPRERLEPVLARLERPERVEFFVIPPVDVSSRDLRRRLRKGEPIEGMVPDAVAREIDVAGLYRCYPDSKR